MLLVDRLFLLGALGTVLGTGLHTTLNTLGVEGTTDDVVADAGQVLYTAAADHDHRVLLQRMTHTGDVSGDLVAVGQTDTGDLTQSGVGLLGGRGSHGGADATLLRGGQVSLLVLQRIQALLHSGGIGLVGSLFPALLDQLIKSRHAIGTPFFKIAGISPCIFLGIKEFYSVRNKLCAALSSPGRLPRRCPRRWSRHGPAGPWCSLPPREDCRRRCG